MQVFSVTRLLVSRVPATRLARLGEAATLQEALKYCDGYHAARNEFFSTPETETSQTFSSSTGPAVFTSVKTGSENIVH